MNTTKENLVDLLLVLLPKTVRDDLLDVHKCELSYHPNNIIITITENIAFDSEKLGVGLKAVFNHQSNICVKDENNQTWLLSLDIVSSPSVVLFTKEDLSEKFQTPNFWAFNTDKYQKEKDLQHFASEIQMKNNIRSSIVECYSTDGLSLLDAINIHNSILVSPMIVADDFQKIIIDSPTELHRDLLVPKSIAYYEQLVGKYAGSKNISEYAQNEFQSHIKELLSIDGQYAYGIVSIVGAHSELVLELCKHISVDSYMEKLEDILKFNSPLSLMSTLEILIIMESQNSKTSSCTQISKVVDELTSKITDTESFIKRCKVFVSFFVFIDTHLKDSQLFVDTPVFYRRLASIAQASLLTDRLIGEYPPEQNTYDEIYSWAYIGNIQYFLLNSVLDCFQEPHWNPFSIEENWFFQDCLGRLSIVIDTYKNAASEPIYEELFASLKHIINPLQAFLPSILDYKSDELLLITDKSHLNHAKNISQYILFLSQIYSFRFNVIEELDFICESIYMNNYRLDSDEANIELVFDSMFLLARMASIHKHSRSAEILRKMAINYIPYSNLTINNNLNFRYVMVGLIGASTYSNKKDWANYIKSWLSFIIREKNNLNQALINYIASYDPILEIELSALL